MRYVDMALSFVHLIVCMYTKQVKFSDDEIRKAENLIARIECFMDEVYENHDDLI